MSEILRKSFAFTGKYQEFILGLILTLVLLWPLFNAPFFSHHDDVQVIRLFELDKCIQDGQIPCRWVPDLGGVYGYPLFNYYAPLAYYYGEIFYLLTGSLLISVKIMFATAFVGAYIFMYLLARKLWGERGGVLSAIFFSFAPYHATLFYVRGAMGELWGIMFLPVVLWAIVRLSQKASLMNILLLSICLAGLICSHNLSTLLFLPIIGCFILVILKYPLNGHIEKINFLKATVVAFFLALSLSAFYWVPMVLEKNLVHVDTTTSGYFSYTEHFKGLRKLFLERSWGWGASVREVPGGERDGLSFQIGWIHLGGWLIALFYLHKFWATDKKRRTILIFSSAIILLSIVMIHPRSEFIWKLIEPLRYVQFPWRFLGIIIFFISLVVGSINPSKKLWIILIGLVVIANISYFRPEKFINTSDKELLTGENWDKQIKRSIYDFLPIYAAEPPAELATFRYEILTGEVNVQDFEEGTNWFKFKADVKTHTIIRVSQYYFPEWKVYVDGKEIPVQYKNNHLGLMTLILGEGNHSVEGRLFDTTVRTLANLITKIGIGIFILIVLANIKFIRRSVFYYLKGIS